MKINLLKLMIKEQYCSFEVSKLLREKGFEEICFAYYEDFGKKQHLYMHDKRGAYNKGFKQRDSLAIRFNTKKDNYKCSAPTQQMAMRWLRKKKRVLIFIEHTYDENGDLMYMANIMAWDEENDTYRHKRYYTCYEPEGAIEEAINYVCENLI